MSATHRTVNRRNDETPRRQPRPGSRRQGTRSAVIAAAIREG